MATTPQELLTKAIMSLDPGKTNQKAAELAAAKVLANQLKTLPSPLQPEDPLPLDDLLTPKQVSAITGQSIAVLAARRARKLPPVAEKTGRNVFYRRRDVQAYVQLGQPVNPHGDETAGSKAAGEILGVSQVTLSIWRTSGVGPAFQMVKGKAIYLRSDLDKFMDQPPRLRRIKPVPEADLLPESEREPKLTAVATGTAANGDSMVWRESLLVLGRVLSPANQTLMRVISEKAPGSIAELAGMMGFSSATVWKSLSKLEKFGLIQFVRGAHGKHRPVLTVQKVNIEIDLV